MDDVITGVITSAPFTVDVLANDKNVDPTTVQIEGTTKPGAPLVVSGQGTWTVNKATGQLTFTPLPTFQGNPSYIQYTVKGYTGVTSDLATVVIYATPVEIGSLIMLSNPEPPLFTLPAKTLPFTPLASRPLAPMWEHDWFKPLHLQLSEDGSQCDLYLVGSLKDQVVFERENYHFAIAASTFKHTNPSENLEYKATRPDGTPLPGWLKFNPKTLTFSGIPPKGAISEEVMVTVKDGCGDEVHATFFVKVNKAHHRHIQRDKPQEVSKAKQGLGKQLHAAGKMGKLQNGRELLDSLRAEKTVKNTHTLKSSQKG